LPPNIEEIVVLLGRHKDFAYCYVDAIVNPSGRELPADIIYDESVHCREQAILRAV
jgi:hypothetical protein